jgi:C_GCAxxG_C_C family probable redox protein
MKVRDIKYTLDIDMKELEEDAVNIFNSGFACSESIIFAIRKHFQLNLSDDAIAMSSGFPWGLGGGGCICGALAGGTIMLGYFFGRTEPGDVSISQCFQLSQELHDYFRKSCGATCCRVLTKGMEKESPKRKLQCTLFVSETVKKTAEIIIREVS